MSKPNNSLLLLLLVLLSWAVLTTEGLASAPVLIKGGGAVAVARDTLLLGELATISGGDAALRRQIGQVSLGPAPQPGRSKTIDAHEISRRLKGSRIDMSRLHLQVAPAIKATRRSVGVDTGKIRAAVKQFLRREMPWDAKTARIKAIRDIEAVKVPAGKIQLKVMASRGCKFVGSVPLAVSIFTDGQFYKKIWVTAVIEVRSQVVMVAKPLGRHQPITADDLKLVDVDLAKVPSQAIKSIAEAVGMRAKRKIFPKTILRRDYVEAPHVVQRGDLVKIVARSATLQLSAQGITKERGRRGERIRVENIDSKKQVYATVVDASTVEVQF